MSTDRTYILKDHKIIVSHDDYPVNPVDKLRGDNLLSCFCFYSRLHNVAHERLTFDYQRPKKSICFKIYMLEHSSIALSLKPYRKTHAFDSMEIGIAIVSEDKAAEFGLTLRDTDEMEIIISKELQEIEDYLNGEVYLFDLYKELEFNEENFKKCDHIDINKRKLYDCIDSCSGFYGSDIKTNGILDYFNETIKKELMDLYPELKEGICQSQ